MEGRNDIFNSFDDFDLDYDSKVEEIKEKIDKIEPVNIDIFNIKNPKFHDRTYINPASIVELAENIEKYGLAQPIIVRELKNGDYERIIGYRRLKAFEYLYNKTKDESYRNIPAVVLDVDEKTALALMISENIHRENLTDYDRVYSATQYIAFKFDKSIDYMKKIMDRWSYYLTNKNSKKGLSDEEIELLEKTENILKSFRIKSLRTYREMLKLLNVEPEIKEAIEKYGWSYPLAIEVNKLRPKKEKMLELIDRIINENLGFSEVKAIVRKELGEPEKLNPFKNVSRKLANKFNKLPESKQKEIEKYISKIEKILEEV
jgi:ParB family chromosome partitioning protein